MILQHKPVCLQQIAGNRNGTVQKMEQGVLARTKRNIHPFKDLFQKAIMRMQFQIDKKQVWLVIKAFPFAFSLWSSITWMRYLYFFEQVLLTNTLEFLYKNYA